MKCRYLIRAVVFLAIFCLLKNLMNLNEIGVKIISPKPIPSIRNTWRILLAIDKLNNLSYSNKMKSMKYMNKIVNPNNNP